MTTSSSLLSFHTYSGFNARDLGDEIMQSTTQLATLGNIDIAILALYAVAMVGMGLYYMRRSNTAEGFMVAGRSIPAWAAGLAVMSAYTSSISYIATPGKAFDDNWHPLIFALALLPVSWIVTRYIVDYYRKIQLISVYEFLEAKLGAWARFYAALSFLLYMVGRMAVILYLAAIVLNTFTPWPIEAVIMVIGCITIFYTLLGGMEAVIWTDVVQSVVMIIGLAFCAIYLTMSVIADPTTSISAAAAMNKFSLGGFELTLTSRTVWVMIIYGLTENLRNLMADQNYVQKYLSTATVKQASRSIWISALIYLPLNVIFLYIGTMLFALYAGKAHTLDPSITKGDQVFPFFIATQVPVVLKGLIIAAILAAAMSTIDSALNCSATVALLDVYKRYVKPEIDDRSSVIFLRGATLFWGFLGTGSALLMIRAKSALDTWWQISGIFGGGILGLFLLALLHNRIKAWQGVTGILASILVIVWGTFFRGQEWWQSQMDEILVGAAGTVALLLVTLLLSSISPPRTQAVEVTRESVGGGRVKTPFEVAPEGKIEGTPKALDSVCFAAVPPNNAR
jgi:SSS family solute:Na+ symporter